jgi:hypothetical protein
MAYMGLAHCLWDTMQLYFPRDKWPRTNSQDYILKEMCGIIWRVKGRRFLISHSIFHRGKTNLKLQLQKEIYKSSTLRSSLKWWEENRVHSLADLGLKSRNPCDLRIPLLDTYPEERKACVYTNIYDVIIQPHKMEISIWAFTDEWESKVVACP